MQKLQNCSQRHPLTHLHVLSMAGYLQDLAPRLQEAGKTLLANCVVEILLRYPASLATHGAIKISIRISGHQSHNCILLYFPRASERRVLPIVGVCLSSSHLLIFTSSHLHIFSSSHLLIFTSSHLHIFSSSHLLIFTSSHLYIFSSSHLLIFTSSHFTSSHLHILSSSHLLIFTSSHPHIFTSSHLLIFTSSHPHIFTSSHPHIFTFSPLALLASCPLALFFTSSHPHIFTSSSHLHILTSPHLLLLPSCPLALLPSCPLAPLAPLALSFFSISLLKAGAGAVPTRRHETQPFRTKRGSIAKNWGKIAISTCPAQFTTLSHEMRFDRQKTEVKWRFQLVRRNAFARNEVRSPKTEVKLRFEGALSHETRFDRQKLR